MVVKDDIVNIKDPRDDQFYKCKVRQVKEGKMKVHYVGWSQKYDEWVALDSSRVGGEVLDVASREPAPVSPGGSPNGTGQLSQGEVLGACGGVDGRFGGSLDESSEEELSGSCAFCNCKIIAKAIECRDCGQCFHAVPECVGLQEGTIRGLLDDSCSAVTYHCMKCRSDQHCLNTSVGITSALGQSAFNQLIVAVGALCAQVRALSQNLPVSAPQAGSLLGPERCSLAEAPPVPSSTQLVSSQSASFNETVRAEVRELQEQSKRKQNVILKGFGDDLAEVEAKFKIVVQRLIASDASLHDLSMIAGQQGMYRAKILDGAEDSRQY